MAPDARTPAQSGSSRAWESLTPALSEWILNAVSSMGFNKMTPVQASTISLFMGNKDVVVESVTGSGKTLAFVIPIVEKLLRLDEPIKKHHVGAIIISPTRELASQTHSVLLSLLGFHSPSVAALGPLLEENEEVPVNPNSSKTPKIIPQLLLGGNQTPAQDLAQFLSNSSNVLIGTPGRLLDILSSPHVHCPQSSFEVLVLDEADRLLDLGFKDDLQKILARLPKQRRTGLFSASVSDAVDQIIRVGLRNPIRISVKVKSASGAVDKRTPASLQMSYLVTKPTQKLPALSQLLGRLNPIPQKSIIYVSTCAAVDYFQHILPILLPKFAIVPLHGKHPPNIRQRNFTRFTESLDPTVLLTTDVAARGLDIPSVDLVVQIDPPSDPKVFLHRCGRAGRAGRRGLAVALLTPGREEDYIAFLAVRKTPVSELIEPEIEVTQQEAENATSRIRELVLTDRAVYDKAQRAFVSWVRAYSKHQASSIFRIPDLDWAELGNAWGLLRLPKMPEVKSWTGDRSLGVSIDFSEFRYKDTAREKHRLEESAKAPVKKIQKETGQAWSVKKDVKDTREARRAKRKTRRESEKVSKMTDQELAQKKELDRMIVEVREQAALDEGEWGGLSD